jgi:hypothetical protein
MSNESDTNQIFFHIIRNKSSRMNWRTRCYSFSTSELLYLEQLQRLRNDSICINDFILDSILLLIIKVKVDAKGSGDTFRSTWEHSEHAIAACRLFHIYQRGECDVNIIDREVASITHLFIDKPSYKLEEEKNRTIESLTEADAYLWTRCTKEQLRKLMIHFRLSDRFTVGTHHFTSEFGLILSLTYYALGEHFTSLKSKFGGNPDFWGGLFHSFVNHLYRLFYNKISGNSLQMVFTDDDYRHFGKLIYNKIVVSYKELDDYEKGEIDELTTIDLKADEFRICGWIDDAE